MKNCEDFRKKICSNDKTTRKVINFSWKFVFFSLVSDFNRRWTITQTKSETDNNKNTIVIITSSITSWKTLYTCRLSIALHKSNYFSVDKNDYKKSHKGFSSLFWKRKSVHCCVRRDTARHSHEKLKQHDIPKNKNCPSNKFITRTKHTKKFL